MGRVAYRAAACALAVGLAGCASSTNGVGPSGPSADNGAGAAEVGGEPGSPQAPAFELPRLEGGTLSLGELIGKKVIVIDFWSTTCDPCLQEMPELVKIYEERKDKGLEILAIATDPPESVAQVSPVARAKGMTFPVLLDEDSDVMDQYNPKGEMPFTAVIDRRGTIVLKRTGYQAGDVASMKLLTDAIDKALAATVAAK